MSVGVPLTSQFILTESSAVIVRGVTLKELINGLCEQEHAIVKLQTVMMHQAVRRFVAFISRG